MQYMDIHDAVLTREPFETLGVEGTSKPLGSGTLLQGPAKVQHEADYPAVYQIRHRRAPVAWLTSGGEWHGCRERVLALPVGPRGAIVGALSSTWKLFPEQG